MLWPGKRILDVLLAERRSVTAARALDERLQIRLAELVVRDGGGVVAHCGAALDFDTRRNTLMVPERALSAPFT